MKLTKLILSHTKITIRPTFTLSPKLLFLSVSPIYHIIWHDTLYLYKLLLIPVLYSLKLSKLFNFLFSSCIVKTIEIYILSKDFWRALYFLRLRHLNISITLIYKIYDSKNMQPEPGSNRQPSEYKSDALPIELSSLLNTYLPNRN